MVECFKQPQSYNIKVGDTILKPDPITIKLPRNQAEWLLRLLAMNEKLFANADGAFDYGNLQSESAIQAVQCLIVFNTIQNCLMETPQ